MTLEVMEKAANISNAIDTLNEMETWITGSCPMVPGVSTSFLDDKTLKEWKEINMEYIKTRREELEEEFIEL